jgi:hypothetical protein
MCFIILMHLINKIFYNFLLSHKSCVNNAQPAYGTSLPKNLPTTAVPAFLAICLPITLATTLVVVLFNKALHIGRAFDKVQDAIEEPGCDPKAPTGFKKFSGCPKPINIGQSKGSQVMAYSQLLWPAAMNPTPMGQYS